MLACKMEHGLEPIRSGISGTIHYIGKWPVNTAEVRLVAATKFPPTDINDLIIGDVLPIGGGDSTNYYFYLKPGDYYLGLVWRASDASWGIQSIFGIYTKPDDPFLPVAITIPDKYSIITGKDMVANFAHAKKATNSRISGKIKFIGTWPTQSENVMVVAATRFPLQSLLDLSFSNLLPAHVDSMDFFIPASPDTYRAVGAVLKIADHSWALDNLIGLLLEGNPPKLKEIIVPDENSQVTGVNLTVYFRGK